MILWKRTRVDTDGRVYSPLYAVTALVFFSLTYKFQPGQACSCPPFKSLASESFRMKQDQPTANASGWPSKGSSRQPQAPPIKRTIKIALVGSGLAGLTAAYRLATARLKHDDANLQIHLFEKV